MHVWFSERTKPNDDDILELVNIITNALSFIYKDTKFYFCEIGKIFDNAINKNDVKAIKNLLENGISPDYGMSIITLPIYKSISLKQNQITKLLIQYGSKYLNEVKRKLIINKIINITSMLLAIVSSYFIFKQLIKTIYMIWLN